MTDLQRVTINQHEYYRIADSHLMRPFFMSIVSASNHWMFIASNGGLTAGRKNSEYALFPYYTDDKITEGAETIGPTTIIHSEHEGETVTWEPFSVRGMDQHTIRRNLYKHVHGDRIIFEEINEDLQLVFRYRWESSNAYGFLRTATLENKGDRSRSIRLLDGVQNVLPYGVGSELQMRSSNLADAYKRTELHAESGLGIYALSAIIVDKAEPSEALKANVVWSVGLPEATRLISARQLESVRKGEEPSAETDVKGAKGAYFLYDNLELGADEQKEWSLVMNVNQNRPDVERLINALHNPEKLLAEVKEDVKKGAEQLTALTAASDGLQLTADDRKDTRQFSNVMFNIMRGGIFDNDYQVEANDFLPYLKKANQEVFDRHHATIEALGQTFRYQDLVAKVNESEDPDLIRLGTEYLPLKFSRRHGDPSRPWNKFSINTTSEKDGSKILDYEGNWRDIFQNWEALAFAYPDFMEGMIHKFLNASTFDGYNPYRVTKGGFDWETIEEDDPWSYIGYWGDHQIIYLLKFLEFSEKHEPGFLAKMFSKEVFTYANVPYRIKPYADLLKDPKDTVIFDREGDEMIRKRRAKMGADGALLTDRSGSMMRVNFVEKILATLLAKISNFIPEGGIWMVTQRPEWNDANNALVGNGVSMATLYYLRRFLAFFSDLMANTEGHFKVSAELAELFEQVDRSLADHRDLLNNSIGDQDRKKVLDALGQAAGKFRTSIYDRSFGGEKQMISSEQLRNFFASTREWMDHSIAANLRDDGLYHAYNLMTPHENGISIDYLDEMLEGQVAILSAHYLDSEAELELLNSLRASALYREDQNSYILYPNKQLPGFLEKNNVPADAVENSSLLQEMLAKGDGSIVQRDLNGGYHFNGSFNNVKDLDKALDELEGLKVSDNERKHLRQTFERVFNHKAFTGRSGTFFGYEGLGSIYWHMVSKLQLAVLECCERAVAARADEATVSGLIEHYYAINEGVGVHKTPKLYGAFPTDPYSHTPAGKGAQQPGMTGQVKEDLLCRFGELGVKVYDGQLAFEPTILKSGEFLETAKTYKYVDLHERPCHLDIQAGELAFTYCQVPVVYRLADTASVELELTEGDTQTFDGLTLDRKTSQQIFGRTGKVQQINVSIPRNSLR
ncbi:hypothetical protein CEQ90_03790 [Lewinellaceae bacterium SD302]|nr:hypothetical protein CEQ90_03790 [Lewinellaceae bacterium SD302]